MSKAVSCIQFHDTVPLVSVDDGKVRTEIVRLVHIDVQAMLADEVVIVDFLRPGNRRRLVAIIPPVIYEF
jgi:hypothetical protein